MEYVIALYLWRKARQERELREQNRISRRRRFWVRPIFRSRIDLGAGQTLVEEMKLNPDNKIYSFFRMNADLFHKLLELVGPHLDRSDLGRAPIDPQTRLAITLRYLASGDSMASLSFAFRVGRSTVTEIISSTLQVLWNVLQPEVLSPPQQEDFKEIAQGFRTMWHYPNCIGAIDGKHVTIQAPPNSGSSFFNYKGAHSIVLMAVVNHRYEFMMVDIGAQGRQSDGGIFRNSMIGRKLIEGSLNIPPPQEISEGRVLPHVIVGDEAFPLLENLMRPYPGRDLDMEKEIYNYRHSRARRVSENAFGILVSRWRIFSRPINSKLETVEKIIQTTVCLHNFLIKNKSGYASSSLRDIEMNKSLVPNPTGENLRSVRQTSTTNTSSMSARCIRDDFKDYFFEEGAVPWQWDKV